MVELRQCPQLLPTRFVRLKRRWRKSGIRNEKPGLVSTKPGFFVGSILVGSYVRAWQGVHFLAVFTITEHQKVMNAEATSLNKNGDGPTNGYCRCNHGRDMSEIRGNYGRA